MLPLLKIPPLFNLIFTNIDAYSFISVIYAFLMLLALLLILIGGFTVNKKRIEQRKGLWQQNIAGLISQAVFSDEGEAVFYSPETRHLLGKLSFRNYLLSELIKAKINLSGSAGQNLKNMYESLKLDADSRKKLTNRKEHIKAKGVQQLAMMEQVKYVKKIFRLTNSTNELVRQEAQCALVGFYGFLGLRFLNVTAYPISEWQQIQLLNKLNNVDATNFDPLKKWLKSPNESVVIFALKLANFYNCNSIYNDIVNCLHSPAVQVKLYALEYIRKMSVEDSADQIISHYLVANKRYQLAVLDALSVIGSEKQISFVQTQLRNDDNDIKSAAAKCLSQLHPSGTAFLQTQFFADQNPWKEIFLQLKTERAA